MRGIYLSVILLTIQHVMYCQNHSIDSSYLTNELSRYESRTEDFKRKKELLTQGDTIQKDVEIILNKIGSLENELDSLTDFLTKVTISSQYTRASKEQAVAKLASMDAIDFILKNYDKLNFLDHSQFESNDDYLVYIDEVFAAENTGLLEIVKNYGYQTIHEKKDNEPSKKWWFMFPLLIDHLDEMTEDGLKPTANLLFLEMFMVKTILENYDKPWLITEFMSANMDNKKSPMVERLKNVFSDLIVRNLT